MITLENAVALDKADVLAPYRGRYFFGNPNEIYLDGNSLGRLPHETFTTMAEVILNQWGKGLVRSWSEWFELSQIVGDKIAPHIGAREGEVYVTDTASINEFKIIDELLHQGYDGVLVCEDEFPTERYLAERIVARRNQETSRWGGRKLKFHKFTSADSLAGPSAGDIETALDYMGADQPIIVLSHAGFKRGIIADMKAINSVAERRNGMVVWNLYHTAFVTETDVHAADTKIAIAGPYKYGNSGPGGTSFLYIDQSIMSTLESPIPTWWTHEDPFGMAAEYVPAPDMRRFSGGTQPIPMIAMAGASVGLLTEIVERHGKDALMKKGQALTQFFIDLYRERLEHHGLVLETPEDPSRRTAAVSLSHPQGYQIDQALIAAEIVPDFRPTNIVRSGLSPSYTSFEDVYRAIERWEDIMHQETYEGFPVTRERVT